MRIDEQLTVTVCILETEFSEGASQKTDEIFPGPDGEAPEAYAW
jgi:hypothetical protein